MDPRDYLHVTSGSSHVIQIFEPRMSFRMLQQMGKGDGIGGKSNQLGEFNNPSGMCVDDHNTLMVCDSGNHRIQFFPQL